MKRTTITKSGSMRWQAARKNHGYWKMPLRQYIRETFQLSTHDFHGKADRIAKGGAR